MAGGWFMRSCGFRWTHYKLLYFPQNCGHYLLCYYYDYESTEKGQKERHQQLSPSQPCAHLTASVHTEQKCSRMLFRLLISHVGNWFYVHGFREQLNATEELHFSLIISPRTPFQCSQCNVSFLYKKKLLITDLKHSGQPYIMVKQSQTKGLIVDATPL